MLFLGWIHYYLIFKPGTCNTVIFIGLLCIYTYYASNIKKRSKLCETESNNDKISSSLWCQTNGKGDMKCSFKNLCYNSDFKFLFVLTNSSVLYGLETKNELKQIKASSVFNHNDLYLKLSIISANNSLLSNVSILKNPVFLLHRFKPDNIMHVIHDDLLPLYLTYSDLCSGDIHTCSSSYSLVFTDEFELGPFKQWYNIFSNDEPLSLQDLSRKKTFCFQYSRTGMHTESVFFQYGFNMPQGPKKSNMTGTDLRQFANYVLHQLGIHPPTLPQYTKCALISRKINRKIVNEHTIEEYIRNLIEQGYKTNVTITKIDVSCNSTRELLLAISTSKLLIGMHGSAMMLAVFLPLGASVVELFPFGISPEAVSPLKVASGFPGIYFSYLTWSNKNETNTFAHPEYPPLLGGINHLSLDEKNEIINTKNIPAVHCCHDRAYLYRMYQDTLIDVTLLPVLNNAIKKLGFQHDTYIQYLDRSWFFPAPVRDVTCYYVNSSVQISWHRPHNVEKRNVEYKLIVSTNGQHFSVSTNYTFVNLNGTMKDIEVWISCLCDCSESTDIYTKCL